MRSTILLVGVVLLFIGCAQSIEEVQSEEFVGETVKLKGEVTRPVKIGALSGYTLVDDDGNDIIVASERLPAESDEVTVSGIIKQGPFGGYYLEIVD